MPVISQKEYSHPLKYDTGQLTLQARHKQERRSMPAAYAPKQATINIKSKEAALEIEYSVDEVPSSAIPIANGISMVFGKFTKKVLSVSFEYPSLDELLSELSVTAQALRARQNLVPQDSIKRNYQMIADGLEMMRDRIETDLELLKMTLDQDIHTFD